MRAIKYLVVLMVCTGCFDPPTNPGVLSSSPPPPPVAVIQPVNGAAPSVPLPPPPPVLKGNVRVLVIDIDKKPVASAKVELSSTSTAPAVATTDPLGNATYPDMRLDTEYQFLVTAPGFMEARQQINGGQLRTLDGSSLNVLIVLEREKASVTGTVVDAAGQPVTQAVIFDGRQSVLSDSAGQFLIVPQLLGDVNLTVARQGYQAGTVSVSLKSDSPIKTHAGTIKLKTATAAPRVLVDLGKNALGLPEAGSLPHLNALLQALRQQGFTVETFAQPGLSNTALGNTDILLLPSPAKAYSRAEKTAIADFVLKGRKLVVTGEWAGFGGFNTGAVNELLTPFGLQLGNDTLRETGNYLSVQSFSPHWLTDGLKALAVYQSASVEISRVSHHNKILARTAETGFRIAETGSFGILAAALYGTGKIIVLGDSSLWLDDDSDGNGVANLQESDNLKLAQQVFSW